MLPVYAGVARVLRIHEVNDVVSVVTSETARPPLNRAACALVHHLSGQGGTSMGAAIGRH